RRQVQQEIQTIQGECSKQEKEWKRTVKKAEEGWENLEKDFERAMEGRIGEVGRRAVGIGEQLESLSRQRDRASEAHDLILYYNDFWRGDTTRLETLRKNGGKEGRLKIAIACRRLVAISKSIQDSGGLDGGEETRDRIEKYCERFEKEILRLFDKAYRKGDPKMMSASFFLTERRHCAQVLLEFNGGNSCVQIFVNQHDFFYSKDRISYAERIEDGVIWESLPFPESLPPKSEPGLTHLYKEIKETVQNEAHIINAVFPNPGTVMSVFLQRVFGQVIQNYLERLLTASTTTSTLAFLRILHLARSQTTQLVEDIKSLEFFRTTTLSSVSPLSPTRAETLLSPTKAEMSIPGVSGQSIGSLTGMLDQIVEEVFVPWMEAEGNRYLEKEVKSLNELYASFLLKFTEWHRQANKTKPSNTLFDRMVNQVSAAAHAAQTSAASSFQTQADSAEYSRFKNLLKISGMSKSEGKEEIVEERVDVKEGDGNLDLERAEKMLKWHAEAVGRMVELSPPGDVPKSSFMLMRLLADSYGRAYIETALDTALASISSYDGKVEPDLKPIAAIRLADMVMHLMQRYVTTALLPLASSSVTVRREMSIYNNHLVVRIEGKINSLL
ncbi:Sec10-domain-containing protein, partial [Atractiella rhizophila]